MPRRAPLQNLTTPASRSYRMDAHRTYTPVDADKTPWLLLDLAWSLPGDSPTRAILSALADAWEELPLGWRKLITAGVGGLG